MKILLTKKEIKRLLKGETIVKEEYYYNKYATTGEVTEIKESVNGDDIEVELSPKKK